MSYTIEYKRMVFREVATKENDLWEDNLWAFVKSGDNNVYDHNGKRSRSWRLFSHGWNYAVIQTVCEYAGCCEGGSLQIAQGFNPKWTSPENYLAIWREAIKKALPFDQMLEHLPIYEGYLRVHKDVDIEKMDKYDREKYDEMVAAFHFEGLDYYDYPEFTLKIQTPEDFKIWHQHSGWRWIWSRGICVARGA